MKKGEYLTLGICLILVVGVLILSSILAKDMEKHIEKVSRECAEKGYGIKASYTSTGDKFYICNEDN